MVSRKITVLAVVALCAVMCSVADAQPRQPGGRGQGGPGGGRGFGGPGGGGSSVTQIMVSLLDVEKVKTELEVLPEQVADIKKYLEEQRANRPQFDFQGFRDLSEEERAKRLADMQKDREKRAKELKAKLGEYLLPPQVDRLEEIALQILGIGALNDADVAAKLKITADQKTKMEEVQTKGREEMLAKMREAFQGGGGDNVDREARRTAMQKQFEDFRKEQDDKVLAILTSSQKSDWEKMKGKTLELTDEERGAITRGGFGGRGGPGGAGGQGRPGGAGRPARPAGDNN